MTKDANSCCCCFMNSNDSFLQLQHYCDADLVRLNFMIPDGLAMFSM